MAEWLDTKDEDFTILNKKQDKWHQPTDLDMFRNVLCGAAGTGKTTLVLLMEHFHDHFWRHMRMMEPVERVPLARQSPPIHAMLVASYLSTT